MLSVGVSGISVKLTYRACVHGHPTGMATGRYVRCTTCSTDRFRTHCSAHTRFPTRPTVGAHQTRCGTVHSSSKQRSPRDCRAHCCPTQPNQSVLQPRGLHMFHSQRCRPSTAATAELRPLAACCRPRCRHARHSASSPSMACQSWQPPTALSVRNANGHRGPGVVASVPRASRSARPRCPAAALCLSSRHPATAPPATIARPPLIGVA